MKFDRYDIIARIFPAILCSIPILIFYHFFLSNEISEFFKVVLNIKWISNISTLAISIYFFAQISRLIGKELYEKIYFRNELYMPTTNFLMHSNKEYSGDFKYRVSQKILTDFGVQLLTKNEENDNEIEARKKIVEVIGLMKARVKEGYLILPRNIDYGFWRNFIGGSTIAFLLSIINSCFFAFIYPNKTALILSIFTTLIYLIPIILSKFIMIRLGNLYAKKLIEEYMNK